MARYYGLTQFCVRSGNQAGLIWVSIGDGGWGVKKETGMTSSMKQTRKPFLITRVQDGAPNLLGPSASEVPKRGTTQVVACPLLGEFILQKERALGTSISSSVPDMRYLDWPSLKTVNKL